MSRHSPSPQMRRILAYSDEGRGTDESATVTPAIARKAGRIAGRLASEGRALDDPGDEIIGATGVVHDEPVLTRNVEYFERIPSLRVESY